MQLITIRNDQPIGAEINSADARELHAFLNSEQEFANWVKNRITQYGFIENQDYIIQIAYTKGRPRKEYFITLNMAKELCMVENNAKGKEARQYFIKCEQELQALKFSHYVNRISELEAFNILQAKRHKQELTNTKNGYKSQLKQHNDKIVVLRHELAKFEKAYEPEVLDTTDEIKRLKLELEIANTKNYYAFYKNALADAKFYRDKYYEAKDNRAKDERVIVSLSRIQKDTEDMFLKIGAVMAYIDNDKNEDLLIERINK